MSQELDFEHIKAIMELVDMKSPIRKPINEKSALSMVDNQELSSLMEKKSNTFVSNEFVGEVKLSDIIIQEQNKLINLRENINEKLQSLNSQVFEINIQKKFYEDMKFILNDYEKFIQNI